MKSIFFYLITRPLGVIPYAVLSFILIGFSLNLKAQDYLLESLPAEIGISTDHITCIAQDAQGFLWFGTQNGLKKFDGYRVTVFKNQMNDPQSISNNTINAIFEDKEGLLWIGTNGGLNRFDPETEIFEHFRHDPLNKESLGDNRVYHIFEDHSGVMWIGTQNGLYKFDKASSTFFRYLHPFTYKIEENTQRVNIIKEFIGEDTSYLLVGYWGLGLFKFDPGKGHFKPLTGSLVSEFGVNWVYDCHIQESGILNVASGRSLFQYDLKTDSLYRIPILIGNEPQEFPIISIEPVNSGLQLLGTQGYGMLMVDNAGKVLERIYATEIDTSHNRDNWISTIFKGRGNEIWIGTLRAGLKKLDLGSRKFTCFQKENTPEMPGNNVTALIETGSGTIMIGTRQNGMVEYDPVKKIFLEKIQSRPNQRNGLITNEIRSLFLDSKDRILIGTWGKGPLILDTYTRTVNGFKDWDYHWRQNFGRYISSFCETQSGTLWIGMVGGLWRQELDDIENGTPKTSKYEQENLISDALSSKRVEVLYETRAGQIWVGTYAGGLNLYNKRTNDFIHFKHDPYNPHGISSNKINAIFEDSKNRLWIGTQSGLNRYDENKNIIEHFSDFPEIQTADIRGILEDDNGNLWLGSVGSLIKFNPDQGDIETFDERDGLDSKVFNSKAFCKNQATGKFFLGGQNGLIVFHPDSIKKNTFIPPVWITSLKRYVEEGEETVLISEKGFGYKKKIELSYENSILIFEFTALNYRNSPKNRYAYKLEGFNDNWIDIGTRREVTFTNLDPGTYTLRVKGSNNDRVWNEEETQLIIKITPPWWKTRLAYLSYFIFSCLVLFGVFIVLRRRLELKNQLEHKKQEADSLKELDAFKSRLFTNLTHEFRTPLTVILGMVHQMKEQPKEYFKKGTILIERNGKNLLRIINQLLDLSKLENQSFKLFLKQGDIISYLRYLAESFQTYANSKNLSLRFFANHEELLMDFDQEQIKQVVSNLISNAIKFTPSGGEVVVKVFSDSGHLKVEVIDTGIGIAKKDLPFVFDRFYQVDSSTTREGEGTGIGLAHSYELVKLMQGQIFAESIPGKGTSLKVLLPITNNATLEESTIQKGEPQDWANFFGSKEVSEPAVKNENGLPLVLIIEDNPDVVVFLKSCLQGEYEMDIAYNGKIGIDKAIKMVPDIIISDVMMPEKDGYEVCDVLKNDDRTSHIPIILLTAKADAASKLTGLKRGADVYLSKPFDVEELMVRLKMMMERKSRLVTYFSKSEENHTIESIPDSETQKTIQLQDEFIQKVTKIVEENYKDEDFSLPNLCQKIGMSRSQLFRKMKAVIDVSPSGFIRSFRLEKARGLLQTEDMTVSEVAWEVGYKDLSHFSKNYLAKFGVLPSVTRK